jgi:hypothetical protein
VTRLRGRHVAPTQRDLFRDVCAAKARQVRAAAVLVLFRIGVAR